LTTHPWQDPALPVPERVEALLAAMTLEEKVAQLGSRWIGKDKGATGPAGPEPESEHSVAPMESEFSGGPALEDASRHGLGQLTRVYGSYPITAGEGAAELVRQQRIVMASSRLGIPAMVHEECLTGFTMNGTARRSIRPRSPGAPPSTRS
jgi:hypothetical protein